MKLKFVTYFFLFIKVCNACRCVRTYFEYIDKSSLMNFKCSLCVCVREFKEKKMLSSNENYYDSKTNLHNCECV